MSLKVNILANYLSQVYVTLAGILILPFYISHMGAEAYGLVGFFSMLQAWFNLLDLGLSPTIARETARYRAGTMSAPAFLRLLSTLQIIFVSIACVGGASLFLSADYIAGSWLKLQHLEVGEVQSCIKLMAIGVALRWMSGLYRGTVSGAEQFVWLSAYNSLFATLRFIGVVPVLVYISASPIWFFGYQLVVAALELAGLFVKSRLNMPRDADGAVRAPLRDTIRENRAVFKFALSSAFTSVVWVFVTQTDKLILSNLIPLVEYGYFTLAVLVAGGIPLVCMPITNSVLPKITKLHAEADTAGVTQLYRTTTQWVAAVVVPATVILVLFAERVLLVWTGNAVVAANAAHILQLFALGNVILSINALPLLLQYASGNLRLHILGNILFTVLYFPVLIVATNHFGTAGAGWSWLGLNLISFFVWLPIVHKKFLPVGHLRWLGSDLAMIALCAILPVAGLSRVIVWSGDKYLDAMILIALGMLSTALGCLGSGSIRTALLRKYALARAPAVG